MKYFVNPSLEHIVLIKIVVTIWNQSDIFDLISDFFNSLFPESQTIENRVIKKVSQLPVPEILKEKLISFVKPICLQILEWMRYHRTSGNICTSLLDGLCWTPQGTIDREKTAEVLISNEKLDIMQRYKLACIYCFENHVKELWSKMPECHRQSLSTEYYANFSQYLMKHYWTNIMQVRNSNPLHSNDYLFESCAKGGNKTATKYFLEKLDLSEREESLVKAATCVEESEVLIFLLSQMNEEQEREVLKSNPYKVLLCLLEWPLQNLFVEISDHIVEFLSKEDFDHLLKRIMDKIANGYKDYNYNQLFEMFWQKSPSGLKSYVIDDKTCGYLLPHVFQNRDKDKMKFLFQDATIVEKRNFFCSYITATISETFVFQSKWDFFQFLIEEWFPSRTEGIKLKEEFELNIESDFLENRFKIYKYEWDQLFFPSKFGHKYNKRELEEAESRPFKAPHIMQ